MYTYTYIVYLREQTYLYLSCQNYIKYCIWNGLRCLAFVTIFLIFCLNLLFLRIQTRHSPPTSITLLLNFVIYKHSLWAITYKFLQAITYRFLHALLIEFYVVSIRYRKKTIKNKNVYVSKVDCLVTQNSTCTNSRETSFYCHVIDNMRRLLWGKSIIWLLYRKICNSTSNFFNYYRIFFIPILIWNWGTIMTV